MEIVIFVTLNQAAPPCESETTIVAVGKQFRRLSTFRGFDMVTGCKSPKVHPVHKVYYSKSDRDSAPLGQCSKIIKT
jgi:hypothetical protein